MLFKYRRKSKNACQNKDCTADIFSNDRLLCRVICYACTDTLTFDWTLAGPATTLGGFGTPGSGNGTFAVTTGSMGDTITAMTGTLGGNQLTMLAPGTFGGNDNMLFPIGTIFAGGTGVVDLDTSGIAVSTVLGDFHIFADGSPFSAGTVSGNDIFETGRLWCQHSCGNRCGPRTLQMGNDDRRLLRLKVHGLTSQVRIRRGMMPSIFLL